MDLKEFTQRFAPKAKSNRSVRDLHALLLRAGGFQSLTRRLDWVEAAARWLLVGGRMPALEEGHPKEAAPLVKLRLFVRVMREVPAWRAEVSQLFAALCTETTGVRLLGRTGLPAEQGFLSEAADRLSRALLPFAPNQTDLSELLARMFRTDNEARWLAALPPELVLELVDVLSTPEANPWQPALSWVADAVALLAARVSALGVSEGIRNRSPPIEPRRSPFIVLPRAFDDLVEAAFSAEGDRRLRSQVARDACKAAIGDCRRAIDVVLAKLEASGVSVALVYRVELVTLLLERLNAFADILAPGTPVEGQRAMTTLLSALVIGTRRDRSVFALVQSNLRLIARKIIERTGQTGEHYITATRGEQGAMLASAAGGGALTALTTVAKYMIGWAKLPLFISGVFASVNYAGSFLAMQLLGFTLATKQPSMTASALAGALGTTADKHLDDLAELMARITRSQLTAAVGNVGAVIPVAVGVDFLFRMFRGHSFYDADTAAYVLHSLHPLTSLLFAILTGVLLWASSVAAGWLENWATYRRLPEAIAAHRLLRRVVGERIAAWMGRAFARNVSGFGGNIALGVLLGMTPIYGTFLGIPLEVRHVTLSTGALALAVCADPSVIGGPELVSATLGILLIGSLNFGVSFALALWVAFRARDVDTADRLRLLRALLKRLVRSPLSFLFAPPRPRPAIGPGPIPPL